jgi:hypothetical protein
MASYATNRDGNSLTNEEGHMRFPMQIWEGNVLTGLQVTQNSTPNMTVTITKGDARVPYNDYSYGAWTSSSTTGIAVTAADTVNPRLDRVVAYIDRTMTFTGADINNPGIFKFKAVAGTPAASPNTPNNSVVQASVGVGNPYIDLAELSVPANATDVVTSRITDTRTFIKSLALANGTWPVGSVYINASDDTNPNTLLGFGTWVAFGAGRVPVGIDASQTEFDSIGETGGAKTHTLTNSEVPSHNHSGSTSTNGNHNHGISYVGTSGGGYGWRDASNARSSGFAYTSTDGNHSHSFSTNYSGGGGSHNNLQPYVVVYMWRRTA